MAGVTLCCIDCTSQPLAIRAMQRCLAAFRFSSALFLTSESLAVSGISVQRIRPILSHAEYSRFVVKELAAYIRTSHVLLIQWDGYIVNPAAWSDEFLDYDYIGAPWAFHDEFRVGNGGFSLRSKRLLDALADPDITQTHPEDVAICRVYRPTLERRHGIRFAPEDVANRFSFESTQPAQLPFGFHALHNMWRFLSARDLDALLGMLAPDVVQSRQYLGLILNFIEHGRYADAAAAIRHRLKIFPDDADTRALLSAVGPRRSLGLRLARMGNAIWRRNP